MVFSRLRETFFSRVTYVLQAPFVHTAEQHCTAAVHGSPHSRHWAHLPLSLQNSDEQQSASVAQAPFRTQADVAQVPWPLSQTPLQQSESAVQKENASMHDAGTPGDAQRPCAQRLPQQSASVRHA